MTAEYSPSVACASKIVHGSKRSPNLTQRFTDVSIDVSKVNGSLSSISAPIIFLRDCLTETFSERLWLLDREPGDESAEDLRRSVVVCCCWCGGVLERLINGRSSSNDSNADKRLGLISDLSGCSTPNRERRVDKLLLPWRELAQDKLGGE